MTNSANESMEQKSRRTLTLVASQKLRGVISARDCLPAVAHFRRYEPV